MKKTLAWHFVRLPNKGGSMTDYPTALRDFIATLCVGQRYDSCVSSPCRYAGRDGCQHPEHPKHQLASRRTPPGGEGGMR